MYVILFIYNLIIILQTRDRASERDNFTPERDGEGSGEVQRERREYTATARYCAVAKTEGSAARVRNYLLYFIFVNEVQT